MKTYTLAYSKDGENWANYKEFGIAKVKVFCSLFSLTGLALWGSVVNIGLKFQKIILINSLSTVDYCKT